MTATLPELHAAPAIVASVAGIAAVRPTTTPVGRAAPAAAPFRAARGAA
jgi:hypothetical protein